MSEEQILVATNNKIVQIRVIGRATFACSQSLRDFAMKIVEGDIKRIVVDFSECDTMDSTFMGVLAMFGVRARARKVRIEIVNSDQAHKRLLADLGLKKLFTFSHTTVPTVTWNSLCKTKEDSNDAEDRLATATVMVEAHQTLIDVDSGNAPKFKNVLDYLKQDIEKLSCS